jgi:folate-dependent phosphoribosylglycinamide formyltransferase PurN
LDALPEPRYTVAVLTVGVLISGSGTNLHAILDRVADGSLPVRIGVVISNRAAYKASSAPRPQARPPRDGSSRLRPARGRDAALVDARTAGVGLVVWRGSTAW